MKIELKRIWLIGLLWLNGCNSLQRLFPQYEKPDQPNHLNIPDHGHGITSFDYQEIAPFDTNKSLIIKVKTNNNWHICNAYEVYITTTGTGGIMFKNQAFPVFDMSGNLLSLTVTDIPIAPKGTEYDIQAYYDIIKE